MHLPKIYCCLFSECENFCFDNDNDSDEFCKNHFHFHLKYCWHDLYQLDLLYHLKLNNSDCLRILYKYYCLNNRDNMDLYHHCDPHVHIGFFLDRRYDLNEKLLLRTLLRKVERVISIRNPKITKNEYHK